MSWIGDAIGYLFFDKANRKTAEQIKAEYEMEKEAKLTTATKEFVKKLELLITSSELLNRPILQGTKNEVVVGVESKNELTSETKNYIEFIECIIESAKISNCPIKFDEGGTFFGEPFTDFDSAYKIWINRFN